MIQTKSQQTGFKQRANQKSSSKEPTKRFQTKSQTKGFKQKANEKGSNKEPHKSV